jgi:hypothetical protein
MGCFLLRKTENKQEEDNMVGSIGLLADLNILPRLMGLHKDRFCGH